MTGRSPHIDDRHEAATIAVATALARIVAKRYPGTSWQPVKLTDNQDHLAEPAGEVVRLFPSDLSDKNL